LKHDLAQKIGVLYAIDVGTQLVANVKKLAEELHEIEELSDVLWQAHIERHTEACEHLNET
jgi:hypothetical protein